MFGWIGRVKNGVDWLFSAGGDLLFPPGCLSCGYDVLDRVCPLPFCEACLNEFGPPTWHGCRRCGARIPDVVAAPERCMRCRKSPLRFDTVVPLGTYAGRLRDVILRMKRPNHDALSMALGALLVARRRDALEELHADMIVPIPMFWKRRFHRGGNSPDVLARCLARSLELPMPHGVLRRCRSTRPQSTLAPSRRFENMRGAFCVCRPAEVKDARILLVDDILTTGATCSEAAKMLKQAGAATVAVAVVARAEGRG